MLIKYNCLITTFVSSYKITLKKTSNLKPAFSISSFCSLIRKSYLKMKVKDFNTLSLSTVFSLWITSRTYPKFITSGVAATSSIAWPNSTSTKCKTKLIISKEGILISIKSNKFLMYLPESQTDKTKAFLNWVPNLTKVTMTKLNSLITNSLKIFCWIETTVWLLTSCELTVSYQWISFRTLIWIYIELLAAPLIFSIKRTPLLMIRYSERFNFIDDNLIEGIR